MALALAPALGLASAGCGKGDPAKAHEEPAPTPASASAPADATLAMADASPLSDAAPSTDTSPPADVGLATAPWPTSIESSEFVNGRAQPTSGGDVEIPRFRTKPPEIGEALNARLATYGRSSSARRTSAGGYRVHCSSSVLSLFAVVVECTQATEETEPEVHRIAVWLQPGLPPIELDQLAPGADASATIARARGRAPAECRRSSCKFEPTSFSLDRYGLVFPPTSYCTACNKEDLPQIPLAEMKSTHPWGLELVAWIRKRAAAGLSLLGGRESDP